MRSALLAALLAPVAAGAQDIILREPGPWRTADILRMTAARPHALRTGTGDLVLPRDSTITSNLLVLGRRTYLSSRVEGDVVVVGGDLFLRTGSAINGRAIAIGGGVYRSFLGSVGGPVESYRDARYEIRPSASGYELTYQGKDDERPPMFQLAGLQGIQMPTYDRVDGLTLPVGALITFGNRDVELQPSVAYISRLGTLDPRIELKITPNRSLRFEAEGGRYTRTNDAWIYSDLVNSAATLLPGNDARNYFRSSGGVGRLIGRLERTTITFEPWLGYRYEDVSPISATGNVFSFWNRDDSELEHTSRPNPLVESGTISSGLAGAAIEYAAGHVKAKLRAEAEKSFQTPDPTLPFTQLTLHGSIEFPTFRDQKLSIAGHAVTTEGDNVPAARFAYLGRAATLPLLELLEQGGDELLFIDSEYSFPIKRLKLPGIGSPTLIVNHFLGSAGLGSLPSLEQEIGVGVAISLVRLGYVFDASGDRKSAFSASFSLPR